MLPASASLHQAGPVSHYSLCHTTMALLIIVTDISSKMGCNFYKSCFTDNYESYGL